MVRKAGRYSCEDLHRAVIPEGTPERRTLEELKAIRRRVPDRHAGR